MDTELRALKKMPPKAWEDTATLSKYMPARWRDMPRSIQNVWNDPGRTSLADLLFNISEVGTNTLQTLLGPHPAAVSAPGGSSAISLLAARKSLADAGAKAGRLIPETIRKRQMIQAGLRPKGLEAVEGSTEAIPSLYEAADAWKTRTVPELIDAQRALEVIPEEVLSPLSKLSVTPDSILSRTLYPEAYEYAGTWFNPARRALQGGGAVDIPPQITIFSHPRTAGRPVGTLSEIELHEGAHGATLGSLFSDPELYLNLNRLRQAPGWKHVVEWAADKQALDWMNKLGREPSGYLLGQLPNRFPVPGFTPELLNKLATEFPHGMRNPREMGEALSRFIEPTTEQMHTALSDILRYLKVK